MALHASDQHVFGLLKDKINDIDKTVWRYSD